uniref:NADH-ubiquinone oxidoreductase chain 6 n=1 Tax=Tomoxia bucephala TaxID=295979 RepID=A0A343C1Z3_9CUCU|nr:NADH dehydrogenase subunit 6 [Tomoxia bucephala]
MELLVSMNLLFSFLFLTLTHPLAMGGTLLMQTTLVALLLGNFAPNFWFSYILFLVMVGGMLVLFIYMTSVASNEMFKTNLKFLIPMPAIIILMYINIQTPNPNKELIKFSSNLNFNQMITKFMNWPSMMTLALMIMYLLITLIVIVKITNIKHGPLRTKN